MIERYTLPEMRELWSENNKFKVWLEVETLALEKMAEIGVVPKEASKDLREKGDFNIERIEELDAQLHHDVIAFLTNVAEYVGENSRYVHKGMTSSDLIDTSFSYLLKEAGHLILNKVDKLQGAIKEKVEEHRYTPCIGRSHGIHAEPTTFGIKLASWYAELKRRKEHLKKSIEVISRGKVAGAVGTYASLDPEVEKDVLNKLGLKPEDVSSQIVHRDRHAEFFSSLALLGSSIERFAVELRHLQRTEVREAEEPFTKKQKGSSAMPHKRNPWRCENLSGLARMLRSYSQSSLENIPLWHERDISHSSVERVIAPDACCLADFMLDRFTKIVSGMVVYPDNMQKNLDLTKGLIFSGTLLLALTDKGILREDAYRLVQKNALSAWDKGEDFKEKVFADSEITDKLTREELGQVFDINRHFLQVDLIVNRALKN